MVLRRIAILFSLASAAFTLGQQLSLHELQLRARELRRLCAVGDTGISLPAYVSETRDRMKHETGSKYVWLTSYSDFAAFTVEDGAFSSYSCILEPAPDRAMSEAAFTARARRVMELMGWPGPYNIRKVSESGNTVSFDIERTWHGYPFYASSGVVIEKKTGRPFYMWCGHRWLPPDEVPQHIISPQEANGGAMYAIAQMGNYDTAELFTPEAVLDVRVPAHKTPSLEAITLERDFSTPQDREQFAAGKAMLIYHVALYTLDNHQNRQFAWHIGLEAATGRPILATRYPASAFMAIGSTAKPSPRGKIVKRSKAKPRG
jgi:hypothetical protein